MTEHPLRSVPTARRTAQHLRFSGIDDAYEHSCILTLLSSLGPLHIVLVDTPSPRGSDATLAGMGTLSEGFERFVAAPARLERVWGAFVVWGAAICGSTDETQDAAPCAVACWRGRTTKNLVPFPTLLVTSIRP